MQELEKAIEISAPEEVRAKVLGEFHRQVEAWGVVLPEVEPVVLDFGLNDFYRVGLIEYWICNEFDAGYCGKYLFVLDGQTCPLHRHKLKTETFFIVKGEVRATVNGRERVMRPGDTQLITPWTPHSFTGLGPALVLELSTPCLVDDNYFENPNIPIGGNYGGGGL